MLEVSLHCFIALLDTPLTPSSSTVISDKSKKNKNGQNDDAVNKDSDNYQRQPLSLDEAHNIVQLKDLFEGSKKTISNVLRLLLPSSRGFIEFSMAHAPLLCLLQKGVIKFQLSDSNLYVAVNHGYARCFQDKCELFLS